MIRARQEGSIIGKVSDGLLKITKGVHPDYPHNFVGIMPCDEHGIITRLDPNGVFDTSGLGGDYKITVVTVNTPVPQDIPHKIEALMPADASWAANTREIHVLPEAIIGTEYFLVCWSQNIS